MSLRSSKYRRPTAHGLPSNDSPHAVQRLFARFPSVSRGQPPIAFASSAFAAAADPPAANPTSWTVPPPTPPKNSFGEPASDANAAESEQLHLQSAHSAARR